jgi:hypothetical protein
MKAKGLGGSPYSLKGQIAFFIEPRALNLEFVIRHLIFVI